MNYIEPRYSRITIKKIVTCIVCFGESASLFGTKVKRTFTYLLTSESDDCMLTRFAISSLAAPASTFFTNKHVRLAYYLKRDAYCTYKVRRDASTT